MIVWANLIDEINFLIGEVAVCSIRGTGLAAGVVVVHRIVVMD